MYVVAKTVGNVAETRQKLVIRVILIESVNVTL